MPPSHLRKAHMMLRTDFVQRLPLWLRPDIPRDWAALRAVLRQHALIFSLMFGMGLIFLLVGGLVAVYADDLGAVLFGAVFFLAGGGVTFAAFYMNASSVDYYYESALLKKRGRPAEGFVLELWSEESTERAENGATLAIERLYFARYSYGVQNQTFESESVIDREDVYSQLQEGMTIPLLVWPAQPTIVRVRQQKLRQQLQVQAREAKDAADTLLYTPQPLDGVESSDSR